MAAFSFYLSLSVVAWLCIFSVSSLSDHESFLRCFSSHVSPTANLSQLLYLADSPDYSSLLFSSIQNLRFASSETPKPLLIVAPADEFQVQASVICCRSHGLPIRARSGGHDYEGLSYRSEKSSSFVLLDLEKLRSVTVDVEHGVAWVEAGATLGELYYKVAEKWQNTAHKLHEDLLLRVDIVHVNRGDRRVVEAAFKSLFLGHCDGLLQHMGERFPALGVERNDCREMSWIDSAVYAAGYTNGEPAEILVNRELQPKDFNKGKSDYVTEPIPVSGWEAIWARLSEEGATGSMHMDPWGGRMSEISESNIPFPHRKGNLFIILYLSTWRDEGVAASTKHLGWIRSMFRFMTPYVSKRPRAAYLNYRDLELGRNAMAWGERYFKDNFRRLAMVKGEVDPQNFFSNEQSVPPFIAETGERPPINYIL
ncbi:Berberine and berberine like [Musa troglodytarum]|uniref:Berberine and berberine like n=1 Tax=Musa troglodytarum TaxID=320322 RepID=A0A9E7FMD5_9LILI|nr:Berberine and berberine like [Musa troglodytarum]